MNRSDGVPIMALALPVLFDVPVALFCRDSSFLTPTVDIRREQVVGLVDLSTIFTILHSLI
jgi:hypothetical protein